jgi:peptidoglycan/LPS O-acetylase OafA/YrhL
LTKYQPDIDGRRAVAVLTVMLFNTFPNISPGGFVGVDIFSVISSHLIKQIITNDLEKRRFTIANFYTRRLRRIFPALILVLIACVAVGWNLLAFDERKSFFQNVFASATWRRDHETSALHPTADIARAVGYVRQVPEAEVCRPLGHFYFAAHSGHS